MSHCPHGKWCHVGFCRVDQDLIPYNNVINDLDDGMQCVLLNLQTILSWKQLCTLEDQIRIQNDLDKL